MIPVLTPAQMAEVDLRAGGDIEAAISRAGAAVARSAVSMMGGTYGRRVVVVAGKGNNGNDGREAARRLALRGVRVQVIDALRAPATLPGADLVIDAAYGTGFRGSYLAPLLGRPAPVLAVDIPSGVDGLTGASAGTPWAAARTVALAALKPGLLFEPGRTLAGAVSVADVGLPTGDPDTFVVEDADVGGWLPERHPTAHKWQSAVWVVAGSPGMWGAAALAAAGAQRCGAGYVRLSAPGGRGAPDRQVTMPAEVVQTELEPAGWASTVLAQRDRFGSLVIGNGLGLAEGTGAEVRRVLAAGATVTTIVDGDGLSALAGSGLAALGHNVIVTPHDGEFARLTGGPPGDDRIAAARGLASDLGCVVLLKGGPVVVARPDGHTLVVASGDARLATAGTGDVLAGVIGALAAMGLEPWRAAAVGAFLHGAAGALGWRHGLVAGDLPGNLPAVLERLRPS